jgi:hypothetical protein
MPPRELHVADRAYEPPAGFARDQLALDGWKKQLASPSAARRAGGPSRRGRARMPGKTIVRTRPPQVAQTASLRFQVSGGKLASQRTQETEKPRRIGPCGRYVRMTRVLQMRSCNARFSSSKAAMM